MFTREEPVVYASPSRRPPIDADAIARYDRDGFLFLPDFLQGDELARYQRALARLQDDRRHAEREDAIWEPERDALRSLFRVHEHDEDFARLAADERILDIVRHVLDDDVYLHQSRVNFKPAFDGREFYWHSDFETWHVEDGMPAMRAISASIVLSDNLACNGPLMLVPGSHRVFISCVGSTPERHYESSLEAQRFGIPDRPSLERLAREGIRTPTGAAGGLLLFDCNTLHGSASNISPFPRNNVFYVYNAWSNQLVEPFSNLPPRPEFLANRAPERLRAGRTPAQGETSNDALTPGSCACAAIRTS